MKIILLKNEDLHNLIVEIGTNIENGWEMQGGICVCEKTETEGSIGMYFKTQNTYYYQTMIKKEGE